MKTVVVLAMLLAIALASMSFTAADKATMERGKQVYIQYCVACHQLDGGGVPGLNPPLEKTTFVLGNKSKLVKIIIKGMNTHEEIEGETYTNVMPPFDYLKDQQVSDVITYIRNSFGNKATAITPAEVKAARIKK